jgi:hypothetical protein
MSSSTSDLPLFDQDPQWLSAPRTPLEKRFAVFHKANPNVYHRLEQRALEFAARGRRRIGIAELAEELRYHEDLRTHGDPFKLNNSYRALYARLLIYRNQHLVGVIETRRQTSHNRAAQ